MTPGPLRLHEGLREEVERFGADAVPWSARLVCCQREWRLRRTGSHVSAERLPQVCRAVVLGMAQHRLEAAGGAMRSSARAAAPLTTKQAIADRAGRPVDEADVTLAWPAQYLPPLVVERLVRQRRLSRPLALMAFTRVQRVNSRLESPIYGIEHQPKRTPVLVVIGLAVIGREYVIPVALEPMVTRTRWHVGVPEADALSPEAFVRETKELPYAVPTDVVAHLDVLRERINQAVEILAAEGHGPSVAFRSDMPLIGGRIDYGGPAKRGSKKLTQHTEWLGDKPAVHMWAEPHPTMLGALASIDLSRSLDGLDARELALMTYETSRGDVIPALLLAQMLQADTLADVVDVPPQRLPAGIDPSGARFQITRGFLRLHTPQGRTIERRVVVRRGLNFGLNAWTTSLRNAGRGMVRTADLDHRVAIAASHAGCVDRFIEDFQMPFRLQATSPRVRAALTAHALSCNALLVAAGRSAAGQAS